MTSQALVHWAAARRDRLKLLWDIRQSVRGGNGQLWRTEQVHGMLVTRLATEFQGYAVELHDAAADHFVSVVSGGNRQVANVIRERMTQARALGRGNATPDALARDFSRLGLTLWPASETADPRAAQWKIDLLKLMETATRSSMLTVQRSSSCGRRGIPS